MRHAKTPLAELERFRTLEALVGEDTDLAEYVDCIGEGIEGFGTLLQDLLALTEQRQPKLKLKQEPLDAVVERSARLFRHDPLGRHRHLELDVRSDASVRIDRNRIHQVLLNLMRNAAQATKDGDAIIVRTLRDDDVCFVEVEDFGTGMSEAVRTRIFSPFFTTKGQGGMGLGLRMSRAAVERQGGSLECTSQLGRGSRFRIRLPSAG
jgi:signal transduction histidine kinase